MDNKLQERLCEFMEEINMDNKQLAVLIGMPVQSIRRWKRGATKLWLSSLDKLCTIFNCSIEFIVGRSDTVIDYIPKERPPFYDRLREIMETKSITRYKLVKETKIYNNYLSVWKKGKEPQLDTLIELADYFGCTIDYLVGRDR